MYALQVTTCGSQVTEPKGRCHVYPGYCRTTPPRSQSQTRPGRVCPSSPDNLGDGAGLPRDRRHRQRPCDREYSCDGRRSSTARGGPASGIGEARACSLDAQVAPRKPPTIRGCGRQARARYDYKANDRILKVWRGAYGGSTDNASTPRTPPDASGSPPSRPRPMIVYVSVRNARRKVSTRSAPPATEPFQQGRAFVILTMPILLDSGRFVAPQARGGWMKSLIGSA